MANLKETLLWQLNAAFDEDKGMWADSLLGAIKDVNAEQAAQQPANGEKSIGEMVNHVTYWKNIIAGAFGKSDLEGPAEDWQAVTDDASWQTAISQLKNSQATLIESVQALDEAKLDEKPEAEGWPAFKEVLAGTSAHDLYHTGQIVKLKGVQGI